MNHLDKTLKQLIAEALANGFVLTIHFKSVPREMPSDLAKFYCEKYISKELRDALPVSDSPPGDKVT